MDGSTRARLVGLLVADAEEQLGQLSALARDLREGPREEAIVAFGRLAHGMKGAASSLQFRELATALHRLEALALGLAGAAGDDYQARWGRLDAALEQLGAGFARMAISGCQEYPAEVCDRLGELLGSEPEPSLKPAQAAAEALRGASAGRSDGASEEGKASVAAPARKDALATPPRAAEGAAELADERISVPAREVDAALRTASALAREAARLGEAVAGNETQTRAAGEIARAAREIESLLYGLRLLPAETALAGLEEETRALAQRLGKEVALQLRGREVRADRRTLQAARTMIRHLVRNALDHGIERPERRFSEDKPVVGRLTVELQMSESTLAVTVEDDGVGFDVPAIRAALAAKDGQAERLASMTDSEVLLRFAAEGGSTRERASEISGRGLGLSAVAQMCRSVGGSLRIDSAKGQGSHVRFSLPPELFAAEILTLRAAGALYGVPVQAVEKALPWRSVENAVQQGPGGRTLAVGETIVPLVDLGALLGRAGGPKFVVVIRSDEAAMAFAVEEVGEILGVVPQSVAGLAHADALVTGLAQLGDGEVLSILNPRRLHALSRGLAGRTRVAASGERLEVVLAEDSLATREVLRVLLEEEGFRVRLAADGEEALSRVRERVPDVLVTDLNMPRRDGVSLTRELRRSSETWRLPIVVLTSQDDEASRRAGLGAGADAYLIKASFNGELLRETLGRLGVRGAS